MTPAEAVMPCVQQQSWSKQAADWGEGGGERVAETSSEDCVACLIYMYNNPTFPSALGDSGFLNVWFLFLCYSECINRP